jgi:RND family efflux transporter MFP subunit
MRACRNSIWLLAASALLAGCGTSKEPAAPLTPVQVARVEAYSGEQGVRYSASIVPYTQVSLAFKSAGYVVSISQRPNIGGGTRNVQLGDYVQAGTVLATVREDDYTHAVQQYKGQLEQANAGLQKAKSDFARAQALMDAQALTQPDYDAAKAQYDSAQGSVTTAQAAVGQAQQALDDCQLRAPIDAWVLARNIDVGDFVGTGTVGFSLGATKRVKAVFGVPDTLLSSVRLGRAQGVFTESLPDEFQGRITAISPSADQKSRTFQVEVTIPNPKDELKAGMVATLDMGRGRPAESVNVVPLSAVISGGRGGKDFAVFVVTSEAGQDMAHRRAVQLGPVYGNQVAVPQGVSLGDRVISNGATLVTDGQVVRVIP